MICEVMTGTDVLTMERMAELLVRYWGLGKPLSGDEKEALLVALEEENKILQGPTHLSALARLRDRGVAP